MPHLGGETNLSIQSLSFLDRVHMLSGVPHQSRLPTQAVQVSRFGGASFLYVKIAEWGNPPKWGNQITVPKSAKTYGRTTWLPTVLREANYFNNYTAKTLMELTMLAIIKRKIG